jgi:hypothetical protein
MMTTIDPVFAPVLTSTGANTGSMVVIIVCWLIAWFIGKELRCRIGRRMWVLSRPGGGKL